MKNLILLELNEVNFDAVNFYIERCQYLPGFKKLIEQSIVNTNNNLKVIGTRHGEKLYETLRTKEEMSKAEDMNEFYRIPSDNRDLNYAQYFTEGEKDISKIEDYNSHNTNQCDVEGIKGLLKGLPIIQQELNNLK
mgnify:CR=1 FL=1|tara:strand:+ start:80 stop:487 length:408 start_codon:yes stop_codon:yes gene_type:complete